MFQILKTGIVVLAAFMMLACVPKNTEENSSEYLDSSAVTKTIRSKLMNRLGPQSLHIQVKTYRDEVQLSGHVDNAVSKQKAGEIAAAVGGVQHVRNDLMVN